MLIGAFAALAGIFPLGFLLALTTGMPTPIDGWQHGYQAALDSPRQIGAFLLYLGFIPVGLLGSAAGVVAATDVDEFPVVRGGDEQLAGIWIRERRPAAMERVRVIEFCRSRAALQPAPQKIV